jgi:DNA-directed RNA polymerase subunit RPC12/RpoP
MSEIVSCKKCAASFEVIEVGGGMTSPEPEPMQCPYCGHETMRLAQGRLRTRPVTPRSDENEK